LPRRAGLEREVNRVTPARGRAGIDRGWLAVGLALLGVAAFQLYHLYGLHISKDLPLWDESAYIGWGEKFLLTWKVGSITNAPFYHILYGGVIAVVGLLPSFFAMQYLLKLTLTLLIFFLTLRFSRSVTLSVLVGTIFAYSYYHLGIDVGVYYGALIPYLLAFVFARRSPLLSLGFSFLAGLGRLEYMAVPAVHAAFLVWQHWRRRRASNPASRATAMVGSKVFLVAAIALWAFNGFVLTRVTVWQFHNRVWFAWSQNYAFFRYQTGRDSGGNPWLDHQFIAERDFPGAHSVAEAFKVNPAGVLQHTWYNIREIPAYLADFAVSPDLVGRWRYAPLYALGAVALAGIAVLLVRRPRSPEVRAVLNAHALDLVLCAGGVIAAAPSVIVSTKANYIMSILPAVLLALGFLHRAARRSRIYARASGPAFLVFSGAFAAITFNAPRIYSTHYGRGATYQDVLTMRSILAPFKGLKLLGTSTASYINYLGRANGHSFIEPLAISPINQQATDLTLAGLIRTHDPDVLLINSNWRSSKSYATAVEGFDFSGWDAHPLIDGTLYTKAGLILHPVFVGNWFAEETLPGNSWRWSRGDATIQFFNGIAQRPLTVRFRTRSLVERQLQVALNGKTIFETRLTPDVGRVVELKLDAVPAGDNRLEFHTDRPAARPNDTDVRELAFDVEGLSFGYPQPPTAR
jgi:hypothetical protein